VATIEYHLTIHDLPNGERPRERLRTVGPNALSTAELLAIILRVGSNGENVVQLASRLLKDHGGLVGLAQASIGQLCQVHGLGEAKAAQLKAALELGQRLLGSSPADRPTVTSAKEVVRLLGGEMTFLEQEHLKLILLNTRNQVIDVADIYKGNINTAIVKMGELFRPAIRQASPAVIVVHNHPSGDPAPSDADIAMTRQVIEAGRMLDIEVLDHVVLAERGHVSLRERGLAFTSPLTQQAH
jgi:DNA repair protein RadC